MPTPVGVPIVNPTEAGAPRPGDRRSERHRSRDRRHAQCPRRPHPVCDVDERRSTRSAAAYPGTARSKADVAERRRRRRECSTTSSGASAGSTRSSTMPASPARPVASRTSTRPMAPLHRRRPDRPVPLRPPRRADDQGGGRRPIVNMSSAAGRHGYAFRTPYSAANSASSASPRASPRSSARTTSASTPSCPGSSKGRAWTGSLRPRRAARHRPRRDGAALPGARLAPPHGLPPRCGGDGRLPAVADGREHLRPVARRRRQRRVVCEGWKIAKVAIMHTASLR